MKHVPVYCFSKWEGSLLYCRACPGVKGARATSVFFFFDGRDIYIYLNYLLTDVAWIAVFWLVIGTKLRLADGWNSCRTRIYIFSSWDVRIRIHYTSIFWQRCPMKEIIVGQKHVLKGFGIGTRVQLYPILESFFFPLSLKQRLCLEPNEILIKKEMRAKIENKLGRMLCWNLKRSYTLSLARPSSTSSFISLSVCSMCCWCSLLYDWLVKQKIKAWLKG